MTNNLKVIRLMVHGTATTKDIYLMQPLNMVIIKSDKNMYILYVYDIIM